jgi:predicted O-methyltransferase YrrM
VIGMDSTLTSAPVIEVLDELHARALKEDPQAAERVRAREQAVGHRLSAGERYELYGNAPLSISREVGRLYYALILSHAPRTIVEFGSSHGISTIYLAAGLRDCDGETLISSEILPEKAEAARDNLRRAGLEGKVEIWVGDALETLREIASSVDMLVLDGRNDQYVSILKILSPKLSRGGLVLADLNTDDPDLLAYQHHVRDPGNGFFSLELPLDNGVELSAKLQ